MTYDYKDGFPVPLKRFTYELTDDEMQRLAEASALPPHEGGRVPAMLRVWGDVGVRLRVFSYTVEHKAGERQFIATPIHQPQPFIDEEITPSWDHDHQASVDAEEDKLNKLPNEYPLSQYE